MFGRVTRFVALAALATHLWVSMVVAPWHHLVAHRGSAENAAADDTLVSGKHCHCRHHKHCAPTQDAAAANENSAPLAPDHEDDCSICQVLAQPVSCPSVPTPVVTPERLEFSPPVSSVQPLLGSTIDPVSRGPPTA